MQTLRHQEQENSLQSAPALLEHLSWVEKLPLAVVAGAILAMSCPGYGVSWLAWVALAPLIILVQGCRRRWEAALTGLMFGLTYHLVALRWLLDLGDKNSGIWFAGQLWFVESLHQSVLMVLFALFIYCLPMRAGLMPHFHRPRYPMIFSVPIMWVFLQWIVGTSPFFWGVPIDQLAYSQSSTPAMIQIARLGGAQLLDFFIVMVNAVLAGSLLELTNLGRKLPSRADLVSDKIGAVIDIFLVTTLLFVNASWGRAQMIESASMPAYWQPLFKSAQPGGPAQMPKLTPQQKAAFAPAVPIALVQGNLSINESNTFTGDQVYQRYINLAQGLGGSLVVLPAHAVDWKQSGPQPLFGMLEKLAKDEKKDVITGVRQKTASTVKETVRIFSADKFNQDVQYMKYRLVPLMEFTPSGGPGGALQAAFKDRLLTAGEQENAASLTILKSIYGRFGASIGAEVVYPDLIVSQVNRGASLLLNLSDLSDFRGSMLGQQLLAACIMRAVENGRYFVVCANTGISAVVDPSGVVTSASIAQRQGVVLDRVQFLNRKTPFTRICTWTPLYH